MIISWDLNKIAKGFNVPPKTFWSSINGNTLSKTSEFTVGNLVEGNITTSQEAFDVISGKSHWAKHIEVRNSFDKASFAPSTSTGKGRKFEEPAFRDKINKCDSYVFCNLNPVRELEQPQAYEIPASLVEELFDLGAIGTAAHISFHKRKVYNKNWKNSAFRFEELFPYEEFRFEPGREDKPQYSAKEIISNAIERIENATT